MTTTTDTTGTTGTTPAALAAARDIQRGDRVTFNAREYGPGDPAKGRPVVLAGTVTRPLWGRARNVSIRTDDGRTFVRLPAGVTAVPSDPRPAVVHPTATTPAWVRGLWADRGLCQQCGQRPHATTWAGNGWLVCWPCCEARQAAEHEQERWTS